MPEALPSGCIDGTAFVGGIGVAKAGAKVGRPENGNGLKRLAERLAKSSRRSPFSRYLQGNYDRFTQILEEYGARWEEIAQWAQDENLTGGKPIKASAARRAYDRERQRRAKAAASEAKKAPAQRQMAPPQGTQESRPRKPEPEPEAAGGVSGLLDKADAERPWLQKRKKRD